MATRTPFNQATMQQAGAKERFYRYFQEEVTGLKPQPPICVYTIWRLTEIQDQISQLPNYSVTGGERNDAIDHCLSGITKLSNEVSDLAGIIPRYDQQAYSQVMHSSLLLPLMISDFHRPSKRSRKSSRRPERVLLLRADFSSRPLIKIVLLSHSTMLPSSQRDSVWNQQVVDLTQALMSLPLPPLQHTWKHLQVNLTLKTPWAICPPLERTTTRNWRRHPAVVYANQVFHKHQQSTYQIMKISILSFPPLHLVLRHLARLPRSLGQLSTCLSLQMLKTLHLLVYIYKISSSLWSLSVMSPEPPTSLASRIVS